MHGVSWVADLSGRLHNHRKVSLLCRTLATNIACQEQFEKLKIIFKKETSHKTRGENVDRSHVQE